MFRGDNLHALHPVRIVLLQCAHDNKPAVRLESVRRIIIARNNEEIVVS